MAAAHLSTQRHGKDSNLLYLTADGIAVIVADSFSSKLAVQVKLLIILLMYSFSRFLWVVLLCVSGIVADIVRVSVCIHLILAVNQWNE